MLAKIKTHLILILLATVLAIFSLASVVIFTDPYTAGFLAHSSFYVSAGLSITGIFTFLGLFLRNKFLPGIYTIMVSASFRQAILLALFITGSIFLKSQGLLFWWVELTLLLFLLFLEIFFTIQ